MADAYTQKRGSDGPLGKSCPVEEQVNTSRIKTQQTVVIKCGMKRWNAGAKVVLSGTEHLTTNTTYHGTKSVDLPMFSDDVPIANDIFRRLRRC
jgi:hypothetical protein